LVVETCRRVDALHPLPGFPDTRAAYALFLHPAYGLSLWFWLFPALLYTVFLAPWLLHWLRQSCSDEPIVANAADWRVALTLLAGNLAVYRAIYFQMRRPVLVDL
jgi:hypothetical protein